MFFFLINKTGRRLRHDVGTPVADDSLAVHEHAVEVVARQCCHPRTRPGSRHPEQVQGEGEQDACNKDDHCRDHCVRFVLDSVAGDYRYTMELNQYKHMLKLCPKTYKDCMELRSEMSLKNVKFYVN